MVPLHMGWRYVLFAHWPIEPTIAESHLPDRLALDTYDGRAWLSIVPVLNVDVRPSVLPAQTGIPVPNLNLRTYVTHDESPAVYFFSLDAESLLAVFGARFFHYLPYYYAAIDLAVENGSVWFTSRRRHPGARPARFRARYELTGSRFRAEPGTLVHFLTERYRYYTEAPDGSLRFATIDHEPWPLYDADAEIEANTLFRANGFVPPDSEPRYFYSPGVESVTSRNKRVSGTETTDPPML